MKADRIQVAARQLPLNRYVSASTIHHHLVLPIQAADSVHSVCPLYPNLYVNHQAISLVGCVSLSKWPCKQRRYPVTLNYQVLPLPDKDSSAYAEALQHQQGQCHREWCSPARGSGHGETASRPPTYMLLILLCQS